MQRRGSPTLPPWGNILDRVQGSLEYRGRIKWDGKLWIEVQVVSEFADAFRTRRTRDALSAEEDKVFANEASNGDDDNELVCIYY